MFAADPDHNVFYRRHQIAKLYECERFPVFGTLRNLNSRYRASVNVDVIVRTVSELIGNGAMELDGVAKTLEVEIQHGVVDPIEVIDRNVSSVRDDVRCTLIRLACDSCLGASEWSLVTSPFNSNANSVAISGMISGVLPEECEAPLMKSALSEELSCVFAPSDLVEVIGAEEIFKTDSSGPESKFLSELERRARSTPGLQTRLMATGPRFVETVRSSGIRSDSSALSKLMRVALDVSTGRARRLGLYDERAVRVSKSGSAPPKIRSGDGASLRRVTLTVHGAGWRLHYWDVPMIGNQSGSVEFDEVLQESDRI